MTASGGASGGWVLSRHWLRKRRGLVTSTSTATAARGASATASTEDCSGPALSKRPPPTSSSASQLPRVSHVSRIRRPKTARSEPAPGVRPTRLHLQLMRDGTIFGLTHEQANSATSMQLTSEPDTWKVRLTTGDELQFITHGYSVQDDHYVFVLLMEGTPCFEVTVLRIPVAVVESIYD